VAERAAVGAADKAAELGVGQGGVVPIEVDLECGRLLALRRAGILMMDRRCPADSRNDSPKRCHHDNNQNVAARLRASRLSQRASNFAR
jgi:hypothetical protein